MLRAFGPLQKCRHLAQEEITALTGPIADGDVYACGEVLFDGLQNRLRRFAGYVRLRVLRNTPGQPFLGTLTHAELTLQFIV